MCPRETKTAHAGHRGTRHPTHRGGFSCCCLLTLCLKELSLTAETIGSPRAAVHARVHRRTLPRRSEPSSGENKASPHGKPTSRRGGRQRGHKEGDSGTIQPYFTSSSHRPGGARTRPPPSLPALLAWGTSIASSIATRQPSPSGKQASQPALAQTSHFWKGEHAASLFCQKRGIKPCVADSRLPGKREKTSRVTLSTLGWFFFFFFF